VNRIVKFILTYLAIYAVGFFFAMVTVFAAYWFESTVLGTATDKTAIGINAILAIAAFFLTANVAEDIAARHNLIRRKTSR
jgi:hypothetical protein